MDSKQNTLKIEITNINKNISHILEAVQKMKDDKNEQPGESRQISQQNTGLDAIENVANGNVGSHPEE